MAKRLAIPSDELKLKLVGSLDSLDIPRVQRVTVAKDVPSTDIYELGDSQLAGTALDTPNVTITFSVFDVGIKTVATLAGESIAAYPASGVDVSSLAEADAILYVKDADLAQYSKSNYSKRLQVRDFSYSYSVDGESTEDYTLVGSESKWLKYDVVVDRFTTGTNFTVTQTPRVLSNGNYGLAVIADGGYLTETTGTPAANEYKLTAAKALTLGTAAASQVIVIYHADADTTWVDVRDTTMPAAVRGRDVKIVIAANDIPRVQNVTINGNLNVQPVRQMGTKTIIGYQRQVPTIDGTLAVMDTDTELLDLLLNGSISSGAEEWEIGTECVASGVGLKVRVYDPCDDTTVVKTVYIPELVLTGDSYASTVNQNATHTFNWKSNTAQCIVYSGSY